MVRRITFRMPGAFVRALHDMAYFGSAYVCLSFVTACLMSLLEATGFATRRL